MKKNDLIYQLVKNSSREMQQLLSEQFGFYSNLISNAQTTAAPAKTAPAPASMNNPAPVSPAAAPPSSSQDDSAYGEMGLTYRQWKQYIKRAWDSVKQARDKANLSANPKKIQRAIEYGKKVKKISEELEKIVKDLQANYDGFDPNKTIISESMLTENGGIDDDEDLGRPQKGKKGEGGGGDEGVDFDAESRARRYDIAPFGPYMNLKQIKNAGLIKNQDLYDKVIDIFGPYLDIDEQFYDKRSIIANMNPYDEKTPQLNGGEFIQYLFDLIRDIQTNWSNSKGGRYLRSIPNNEFIKAQMRFVAEWREKLTELGEEFARESEAAKKKIK